MPVPFEISFTTVARAMFAEIVASDKRGARTISQHIAALAQNPQRQGKLLAGELAGFRSMRTGRYRVVYFVGEHTVVVLAVGIRKAGDRKDIYALAKRLLKSGLVDLPSGK
ncbi:MAG: type II toxin-antitoxin system RelE/ParE family toxin [Candidatus Bipolaricaulota bacterium]